MPVAALVAQMLISGKLETFQCIAVNSRGFRTCNGSNNRHVCTTMTGSEGCDEVSIPAAPCSIRPRQVRALSRLAAARRSRAVDPLGQRHDRPTTAVHRCDLCLAATSPDRPFVHRAAFSEGEGRQSGTNRAFAVSAPMLALSGAHCVRRAPDICLFVSYDSAIVAA